MIINERLAAQADRENFVVFLIGMRINKPWKLHKWLPVGLAMTRMIRELEGQRELGLRHVESWNGRTTIMVQYWDSFASLDAYAKSRDQEHLPAWTAFNKAVASNGDVGIWHETYEIKAQSYECVYNNMPPFGLAKAFQGVPATGALTNAVSRKAAGGSSPEIAA